MDRLRHSVELERLPTAEAGDLWSFLESLAERGGPCLLRNDLVQDLQRFTRDRGLRDRSLRRFLRRIQEVVFVPGGWVLMHRPQVGRYVFYELLHEQRLARRLTVEEFLDVKERLIDPSAPPPEYRLRLDFSPFRELPALPPGTPPGSGLHAHLPRLAEHLAERPDATRLRLLRFLATQGSFVDPRVLARPEELRKALESALEVLGRGPADAAISDAGSELHALGLGRGFGATAGRASETLRLLLGLLEAPRADGLRRLARRLPLLCRMLLISPHGWFAQEGVLGRPDTGGQVIYVLDQVRALEAAADRALEEAGLPGRSEIAVLTRLIPESDGTTCDQPRERIGGSRRARILRVPFRHPDGQVLGPWRSRFRIWPYLEGFAREAREVVREDLGGGPDLVVGNYSDGNLVASRLAHWEGATQVAIAHALEKTKYLFSELYWKDLEAEYGFSRQFTADLLAMNLADLLVTSSQQEIAGNRTTFGQYESYSFFTMPGLYRVTGGIDLFDPRFHVIPPGVDESIYFPYWETERRSSAATAEACELLYSASHPDIRGVLQDPSRRPLFAMSRLDRVKNVTGLVDAFGRSSRLRDECNLILVTGRVFPDQTEDLEERAEIERLAELLEHHGLWRQVRWLGTRLPRRLAGEVYRTVADRGGFFVQPARFEAFGLTVLEAMASGLPTFATRFGGPLEILEHGHSGFLVNPTVPELLAAPLEKFLEVLDSDPDEWERVSRRAVARVDARYRWRAHAEELLAAVRLHKLWRALAVSTRGGMLRYAELLHRLLL